MKRARTAAQSRELFRADWRGLASAAALARAFVDASRQSEKAALRKPVEVRVAAASV